MTRPAISAISEEWPKSAPFFFSATLLAVLNPFFFWGVQMEFSIQIEINSFHPPCTTPQNPTVVLSKHTDDTLLP